MAPGFSLEAVYSSLVFLCWRSSSCRHRIAHEMFPLCVYFFFFFLISAFHPMLTSGNSPAPEKSLVLHKVILKFHKRLTFPNTFLGCFCRKGMTRWENLLLSGVFKDSAKTSWTLSYCCNKNETMKALFVFSLFLITNLQWTKRKVTFKLIFIGTRQRSL